METLIRSLEERDAETMPLADAVEFLAREDHCTVEYALAVVDDAIADGKLTLNNAFEIGLALDKRRNT